MAPLITPVPSASEEKCCAADLLNRQEFVQQIISVAETLSENKRSACYAINGEWGVGKTFVLKEFEKQISEFGQGESTLNKYLVFHYNCWEYDYYEEPLIALVAVILEQIDTQVKLISDDKREKIKAVLKIVGHCICKKAKETVEDKTGIPAEKIAKLVSDMNIDAKAQIEASHQFDVYFEFKKTLKELSKVIAELAKEQTVLLVVDELDRCLPEYAIKVLERLHHVFEDVPNVQVILAVDKQQLENTVKQIYGDETSVEAYLEKFINFELRLKVGRVKDVLQEQYPVYYRSFAYNDFDEDTVTQVYQTILNGVGIRRCKVIIEKSYLCHKLLNSEEHLLDGCFLCIELFLTLLKTYGLNSPAAKRNFNPEYVFTQKNVNQESEDIFRSTSEILNGLSIISEKYKKGCDGVPYLANDGNGTVHVNISDLWGVLLGCYRIILGYTGDVWRDPTTYSQKENFNYTKNEISQYVRRYWGFLKIIS